MTQADGPYHDAAHAAAGAYTAAAGSHTDRLQAVLDTHLRELAVRGLLAGDPPSGPVPTLEEDARWLAGAAGHPRFTGGLWRNLLASEPDILMAYRCATDRRPGQAAAFSREQVVRDRLLRHVAPGA